MLLMLLLHVVLTQAAQTKPARASSTAAAAASIAHNGTPCAHMCGIVWCIDLYSILAVQRNAFVCTWCVVQRRVSSRLQTRRGSRGTSRLDAVNIVVDVAVDMLRLRLVVSARIEREV